MLLTAQRVVSPLSRARGVNVYLYLHGSFVWDRVPNEFLPEANPGELVAQWIQLAPGGNRVISFLDVVAPDDIDEPDLHIHYSMMKQIYKTLYELVTRKNGQMIVASHSEELWKFTENIGGVCKGMKGSINE